MQNLINKSPYDFMDITGEIYRIYIFPNNQQVKVENVTHLAVSKTGHRLFDGKISHYIPFGWLHLYWKNKKGQANFLK